MTNNNILQINSGDKHHRAMFFDFIKEVYPRADFRTWYELGYWSKHYVPHALVVDNRIVANVAASTMDIIVGGNDLAAVQIGTVGTLPEYRGRGYSRLLMERVLDAYNESVDIFFLFANETVLEFYTRFGFEPRTDSLFITSDVPACSKPDARPLNINDAGDRAIVARLLKKRIPLTERLGARNYDFVFYWHWINSFPQDLLYLEDTDMIAIVTRKGGILKVWDIIAAQPLSVHEILPRLIDISDISSVHYYFPPDVYSFKCDEVIPCEGSGLFVRGPFKPGEQPFKLPVTAET